jgi:hypothetical protein
MKNINTRALIVEDCEIDPVNKTMKKVTKNITHSSFLIAEEIQFLIPHPQNPNWTLEKTGANFISSFGRKWGISSKLEKSASSKFCDNMEKVSSLLYSHLRVVELFCMYWKD